MDLLKAIEQTSSASVCILFCVYTHTISTVTGSNLLTSVSHLAGNKAVKSLKQNEVIEACLNL